MAKTIDYEFKRGDTYKLKKFRIKDLAGNVIDLTSNEQLYFTVKENANTNKVILQKTLNNGIEYSDGYYHITMHPSDTNGLKYGTYVYDIELKSTELVKTLIEGEITLTEEVTWEVNE